MVNEYIRYRIPSEKQQVFLSDYTNAAAYLRASPVCLSYEMNQCEEEAECFILRIIWQSTESHLTKFRGSPDFYGFLALVRPYISNIEEMRHYTITEVRWSRNEHGV
jgi:hemoglobin